jgi:hypothetical protein
MRPPSWPNYDDIAIHNRDELFADSALQQAVGKERAVCGATSGGRAKATRRHVALQLPEAELGGSLLCSQHKIKNSQAEQDQHYREQQII